LKYSSFAPSCCCCCRAAVVVHHHLFHTSLDLNKLSIRGFHRPPLLETWSQQRLMVNSRRIRGRGTLRSAPRLLGSASVFALGIQATGFWRVLAADRAAFRIPLVTPLPLARFWGGISCIDLHMALITMRPLRLAAAFSGGHSGRECRSHVCLDIV
jgi:hypothetical protein